MEDWEKRFRGDDLIRYIAHCDECEANALKALENSRNVRKEHQEELAKMTEKDFDTSGARWKVIKETVARLKL